MTKAVQVKRSETGKWDVLYNGRVHEGGFFSKSAAERAKRALLRELLRSSAKLAGGVQDDDDQGVR